MHGSIHHKHEQYTGLTYNFGTKCPCSRNYLVYERAVQTSISVNSLGRMLQEHAYLHSLHELFHRVSILAYNLLHLTLQLCQVPKQRACLHLHQGCPL